VFKASQAQLDQPAATAFSDPQASDLKVSQVAADPKDKKAALESKGLKDPKETLEMSVAKDQKVRSRAQKGHPV